MATQATDRIRFHASRRVRVLALAVLILLAVWWLGPLLTPLPVELSAAAPPVSVVVDRHGVLLRQPLEADAAIRRAPVDASPPPLLVHCILAAEDKRYASHGGVDGLATLRAVLQLVARRERVSGASTITQQWVKLRLHRNQPRTLARKLREMWYARVADARIGKQGVLAAYLAEVDMGNRNRGMERAARDYFGKPAADLSLAECATLAALPQAPGWLNPRRHPQRVLARRALVLDRLAAMNVLPAGAVARARAEPLVLRAPRDPFLAPHFVDELGDIAGDGVLRTTLDLGLQEFVQARVRHHLSVLEARHVAQAAVLVLDNRDGGVRVLVGSADYAAAGGGQVNHVRAKRSPGSTLKPFTYLLAFEQGYGPWSLLADIPSAYPTAGGPYRPENYDKQFRGPVTARAALSNSLNVPAVRLLNDCGGPHALAGVLERCGLRKFALGADDIGLGFTLGNAETTLWDLAVGYGTLARGGLLMRPVLRDDDSAPEPVVVAPAAAVWLVTDILRDNSARAGTFSLSSPLRLPWPVAAKTGTSTDFRDNWTVGYTPEYTVAVWVGNSDGTPMRGVSGVDGAAPIFRDVMMRLHRDVPPRWPPPPESVVEVRIDPRSGCQVARGHPRAVSEFAAAGQLPPPLVPGGELADGRVLLPAEFRAWLRSPANVHPDWYALRADGPTTGPPYILFPPPGATLLLDPQLPGSGKLLTLETDLDAARLVRWSSPTLVIDGDGAGVVRALLVPGRHELTATNESSGQASRTWVVVKER